MLTKNIFPSSYTKKDKQMDSRLLLSTSSCLLSMWWSWLLLISNVAAQSSFSPEAQEVALLPTNSTRNSSNNSSASFSSSSLVSTLILQDCNGGCDALYPPGTSFTQNNSLCADDGSNAGLTFYCDLALACYNQRYRVLNSLRALQVKCTNRTCPCEPAPYVYGDNVVTVSTGSGSGTNDTGDQQVIIGAGFVTVIVGNQTAIIPILHKNTESNIIITDTSSASASQRMPRLLLDSDSTAEQCNAQCSTQSSQTVGLCVDDGSSTGLTLNCVAAYDCYNSTRAASVGTGAGGGSGVGNSNRGAADLRCFTPCPCDDTNYAWYNNTVSRYSSTTAAAPAPLTTTTTERPLPRLPIVVQQPATAATTTTTSTPAPLVAVTTTVLTAPQSFTNIFTASTTTTTTSRPTTISSTVSSTTTTATTPTTTPPAEVDLSVLIVGNNNQTFDNFRSDAPLTSSTTTTTTSTAAPTTTPTTTTTTTTTPRPTTTTTTTTTAAPPVVVVVSALYIPTTTTTTASPTTTTVRLSTTTTAAPASSSPPPPPAVAPVTTLIVLDRSATNATVPTTTLVVARTVNGTSATGTSSAGALLNAINAASPSSIDDNGVQTVRIVLNNNSTNTSIIVSPASTRINSSGSIITTIQTLPAASQPAAVALPPQPPLPSRSVVTPAHRLTSIDLNALARFAQAVQQPGIVHGGNTTAADAAAAAGAAVSPENSDDADNDNDDSVIRALNIPLPSRSFDNNLPRNILIANTNNNVTGEAARLLQIPNATSSSTSTTAAVPTSARMGGDAPTLAASIAATINDRDARLVQDNVLDGAVPGDGGGDDDGKQREGGAQRDAPATSGAAAAAVNNELDAEDVRRAPKAMQILPVRIVIDNVAAGGGGDVSTRNGSSSFNRTRATT